MKLDCSNGSRGHSIAWVTVVGFGLLGCGASEFPMVRQPAEVEAVALVKVQSPPVREAMQNPQATGHPGPTASATRAWHCTSRLPPSSNRLRSRLKAARSMGATNAAVRAAPVRWDSRVCKWSN